MQNAVFCIFISLSHTKKLHLYIVIIVVAWEEANILISVRTKKHCISLKIPDCPFISFASLCEELARYLLTEFFLQELKTMHFHILAVLLILTNCSFYICNIPVLLTVHQRNEFQAEHFFSVVRWWLVTESFWPCKSCSMASSLNSQVEMTHDSQIPNGVTSLR